MFSEYTLEVAFLKSNFQDFDKFKTYYTNKNTKSHKKGLDYIQSLQQECFFCQSTQNLSFYHKNPLDKKYEISQIARLSQKSIMKEVSRCWCVCKTCKNKISNRLLDPLPDYWQ